MDRITFIQYLIAKFVLWSLAHSPLGLARFYAKLLDLAVPRLRRTARRNLELAYPDKTPAEREAIADEVFLTIARLLYAFARFPQITARQRYRLDPLRRTRALSRGEESWPRRSGTRRHTSAIGN